MCSLVFDFSPGEEWPLVLAANRDEMRDRPWDPPARYWRNHPGITAGRDRLGGGTWLGINDAGVVAAVLNRKGSLGPAAGCQSRGLLVLEALAQTTARHAVNTVLALSDRSYRTFNMIIADATAVYWLRHAASPGADFNVQAIKPGLHMITAFELDDLTDPRVARFRPAFSAVGRPQPDEGLSGWQQWIDLLGSSPLADDDNPLSAMSFTLPSGFGTVCSSLVALPRTGQTRAWQHFFAGSRPDYVAFQPVGL